MATEKARPGKPSKGLTFSVVQELAAALPGMEEGTSYGTPALRVRGKFVARLREDGETVALRIGFPERDALMESDPETFFITEHYLKYPSVLVRLCAVSREVMKQILITTWRQLAPQKLVAQYDAVEAAGSQQKAAPRVPKRQSARGQKQPQRAQGARQPHPARTAKQPRGRAR